MGILEVKRTGMGPESPRSSSDAQRSGQTVVIAANTSWNLVNFRSNIIIDLIERGFRVVALAPRDAYSEQLEQMGVEFHELEVRSSATSPLGDALLFLRYLRLLRSIRPAVFLGFTIKPNIYGSLAAQLVGSAVVNNITGLGMTFTKKNWLSRLVSVLYRMALRRSSTVFFQNRDDHALFVKLGLISRGQARQLSGSGVDLERFRGKAASPQSDGGFGFLLVGRLLWDKGVGEYVEAAAIVHAAEPTVRCRILGFLEVDNRSAVPRAVLDQWVADAVIEYLGEANDVRPFMNQADCVVLPSYYREGIPRSLLEAAAMGKPIIATDAPGMREIVDDGVTGYLVEPRDTQSLADAMLKMVRMPLAQRRDFGAAGRLKAEREFGQDIVTQRYRDAIDRALRETRRSSFGANEPGSLSGS